MYVFAQFCFWMENGGGKKVEGFGAFVTHTDERRLAPVKLLSLFFFFFFILSQHPSTNYTRQPKLPSTFSSNDNSMMRNRATKRFVIQSTENCWLETRPWAKCFWKRYIRVARSKSGVPNRIHQQNRQLALLSLSFAVCIAFSLWFNFRLFKKINK